MEERIPISPAARQQARFFISTAKAKEEEGGLFCCLPPVGVPPRVAEREASPCFPSLEAEHGGSNPNLPPVHCNVSRSTVDGGEGGRLPPIPPCIVQ